MLKVKLARGVKGLLLMCVMFALKTGLVLADYDSTYVMAVKQKFVIPEDVINGDYVGKWLKTWTWNSGNNVSFKIEKNFNSAFAISSTTGIITISDFTKISGKIKTQDTIINIIIRSTDPTIGYELDTAQIWVKESAYCRFADPQYTGTEKGTRKEPNNDIDDLNLTPGYGYFFKRGSKLIQNSLTRVNNHNASAAHPTIIAAYGSGNNPEFNGNSAACGFMFFNVDGDSPSSYIYLYDLTIRNYDKYCVETRRPSHHFGYYNLKVSDFGHVYGEGVFSNGTQSYADSLTNRPTEFINCVMDSASLQTDYTAGPTDFIKMGVGPARVINCKFSNNPGMAIRFTGGKGHVAQHNYITGSYEDDGPNKTGGLIQIRGSNTLVEDNWIFNASSNNFGIQVYNTESPHNINSVTIRNNLIVNASQYGITINPGEAGYRRGYNYVIEDNHIKKCSTGIFFTNGDGSIFRRNRIEASTSHAIHFSTSHANYIINPLLYYNIIEGNVICEDGNGVKLYNNTITGSINLTGTSNSTVRNNFYQSLSAAQNVSNNISLGAIVKDNYFSNYSGKDYSLKSTAANAINKGYSVNLTIDFFHFSVSGLPDIGAFEYGSKSRDGLPDQDNRVTNHMPVVSDQVFNIVSSALSNYQIGSIKATDEDQNQILSFSIISGNGSGYFNIDGTTGDLRAIDNRIFSAPGVSYELGIQVTDNGTEPMHATATVTINVIGDINIVHIDPENTNDAKADGSAIHPFDSWRDITWKEGISYLQKRGTTANVDKIVIGASHVSLGAYGEGETPVILSHTNTYLVTGFEKSDVKIQDLNLQADNAVSTIYFLGTSSDSIVVDHCVLDGNTNAIKVVDGITLIAKYNLIKSRDEGIFSTATTNEIYYNIFDECNTAVNILSDEAHARIYNNVFVGNTKSVSVSYAELALYNNIFYMTGSDQMAVTHGSGNIKSDHNIYFPEQNGFFSIEGITFNKLGELQQNMRTDLKSLSADPEFVDMLYKNYKIRSTSPAINAGANLNLKSDYEGTKVPLFETADIGAYEFNGNISNPTKKSGNISVYPNPSRGQFSINAVLDQSSVKHSEPSINVQELKILDITGKTILSKIINSNNSTSYQDEIDLSECNTGIYFVVLKVADIVFKEKILINK